MQLIIVLAWKGSFGFITTQYTLDDLNQSYMSLTEYQWVSTSVDATGIHGMIVEKLSKLVK